MTSSQAEADAAALAQAKTQAAALADHAKAEAVAAMTKTAVHDAVITNQPLFFLDRTMDRSSFSTEIQSFAWTPSHILERDQNSQWKTMSKLSHQIRFIIFCFNLSNQDCFLTDDVVQAVTVYASHMSRDNLMLSYEDRRAMFITKKELDHLMSLNLLWLSGRPPYNDANTLGFAPMSSSRAAATVCLVTMPGSVPLSSTTAANSVEELQDVFGAASLTASMVNNDSTRIAVLKCREKWLRTGSATRRFAQRGAVMGVLHPEAWSVANKNTTALNPPPAIYFTHVPLFKDGDSDEMILSLKPTPGEDMHSIVITECDAAMLTANKCIWLQYKFPYTDNIFILDNDDDEISVSTNFSDKLNAS